MCDATGKAGKAKWVKCTFHQTLQSLLDKKLILSIQRTTEK